MFERVRDAYPVITSAIQAIVCLFRDSSSFPICSHISLECYILLHSKCCPRGCTVSPAPLITQSLFSDWLFRAEISSRQSSFKFLRAEVHTLLERDLRTISNGPRLQVQLPLPTTSALLQRNTACTYSLMNTPHEIG